MALTWASPVTVIPDVLRTLQLKFPVDLIKYTLNNLAMDGFAALADPTRRSIIAMLASGERSAGEIGAEFTITAPAVSQHLKALREARLVRVRAEAQRRIYRLDPEGFRDIEAWLSDIRQFWSGRLDALEAELSKPHQGEQR